MRFRHFIVSTVVVFTFLGIAVPRAAHATQPQDWYVGVAEEGSSAEVTVFFPGVMTTLDHRLNLYHGGNQLWLTTGGIVTYPFANLFVGADLRFLLFSVGGKIGFQDTWRNFSFDDDEELSRQTLREHNAEGAFNNVAWPWVQARVSMAVPFNDYVLALTEFMPMHMNSPDRTYDWQANLIHDQGMLYTWDSMLFFKHKKFGAVGPLIEVQDFGLDGKRHTQINYGFTLLSRAGLIRRDDLIVWQMKFHSGNKFLGGYDNSDVWGSFLWRASFNILIAYRARIPL
jgi:hypothetical protein